MLRKVCVFDVSRSRAIARFESVSELRGTMPLLLSSFGCFGCLGSLVQVLCGITRNQRKTKGQQLKGKIVSALFHTFWHFSTLFHTFSEFFRIFPPGLFRRIKGFYCCFSSKRRKDNKKKKTEPFCTLVVARLSSSEESWAHSTGHADVRPQLWEENGTLWEVRFVTNSPIKGLLSEVVGGNSDEYSGTFAGSVMNVKGGGVLERS